MRFLLAAFLLLSPLRPTHAFDLGELTRGGFPGLELTQVDSNDVASFKGTIELPGTFIAEWIVGVDSEIPNEKSYTFWPTPEAISKLPHWAGYIAKTIDVANGSKALVMFAGPQTTADFERHKVSKVVAVGTIVVSTLDVWVECDAANALAHAIGAKDVSSVTVGEEIARVGCNGPYELKAQGV